MKTKGSLVILMPGFAKDEDDTTCIPLSQSFIKTINRNYPGIKITVLALFYPFTEQEYSWNHNRVVPFNGNSYSKLRRPMHLIKVYRELASIKKKENLIGLLSFWCSHNALAGHYFSRFNKVPHYCWLQGQDARKGNAALKYFKPPGTEIIALSDFLKTEFSRNYRVAPAHVIPGALADFEFLNIEKKTRTIDILGVGSLIPLKRYEVFVEVIAKLKESYPTLNAVLCGIGPEETRLKNLIQAYGLESNLTLTGLLPHREVLQLMYSAKILLHPSGYEGYGRVFLEALASGCHVVSFVKPDNKTIEHWQQVNSIEEMIKNCSEILLFNDEAFYPVKPYGMDECVEQILSLFSTNS